MLPTRLSLRCSLMHAVNEFVDMCLWICTQVNRIVIDYNLRK